MVQLRFIDIHEAQAGYDNALAQEISAITEKQVLENQLNNYTGLDSQQISPNRHSKFDWALFTSLSAI